MIAALKHTIIALFAILCVEVTAFGNYVASAEVTGTENEVKAEMAMEVIYDTPYVPPVEKEEIVKAVEEEPEEVYYEPYYDSSYDYYGYYAESDYGDVSSVPSYDGSGYFDANVDGAWISGSDFQFNGVHSDGSGYSYTYYSQNVLPGGGLDIPGRHVNAEGYVCDGDGNICIASDDLPKGTVVNVPFGDGTAVVYDCGSGYGNLDVYVSW